jgi:hypothetical protein
MKKVKMPNLATILEIGDTVYDAAGNEGIVQRFVGGVYPIIVQFDNGGDAGEYTPFGKMYQSDLFPAIYLDRVCFVLPTVKPEPDWANEFTQGRVVWVRQHNNAEWSKRIAIVHLPKSIAAKFVTTINDDLLDTAAGIATWSICSLNKPNGVK